MADELKPTFDFTKISRQWSKAMSASIQKGTRAQIILQRPSPENASAAVIQAYYDDLEAALDTMEHLSDEQAELVAQVLVDVPREWLLGDAPDELDWSKVESFDHIQESHYGEILELIRSGDARKLVETHEAKKEAKK